VTPSTDNTTPTGNGEVAITSPSSGSCTAPASVIVAEPAFTG